MLFNKEDVLSYLPHRDPFLFIDSVESIDFTHSQFKGEGHVENREELVGAEVKAHFAVTDTVKVLEGHFPGNPILPGVVQIETMAQAACFLTTCLFEDFRKVDIDVALLTVNDVKFRKPVTPGDNLVIYAKLLKHRGKMMSYDCRIECEGQVVSASTLMASMSYEIN